MCNYKILAHSEHGYIILCSNCKHYQLAFGTTAVTFKPSDYALFKKQLNQVSRRAVPADYEQQKSYSLDLLCRCTAMVLTGKEIQNLKELVQEAGFNEDLSTLFEDLNLSAG